MRYILFVGGRVGLEAVRFLGAQAIEISHVFVEREHAHEVGSYFEMIFEACQQLGIPISDRLDSHSVFEVCRAINPDYLMCFGYRRMIHSDIIQCAKVASLGSHFSPLPRYRGFAPLNWVLINGERATAVNVFFLADEVDSGDIISREIVEISDEDDIRTLTDKCLDALPRVLEDALAQLESGDPQGEPQDHSLATFACSRNPDDGLIDWSAPSRTIYNLVRALTHPMPGAFTWLNGRKLYVWKCRIEEERPYAGRVHGKVVSIDPIMGVKVLTGDGSLWLTSTSFDSPATSDASPEFKSVRVTLGQR